MLNELLNILGGKCWLLAANRLTRHSAIKSRDDSEAGPVIHSLHFAFAAFPAKIFNTSLVSVDKLNTVYGAARRLSACLQFGPVVFSSVSVKIP